MNELVAKACYFPGAFQAGRGVNHEYVVSFVVVFLEGALNII